MTNYTIREDQTLFDIAVQKYGSIEGIAYLLEDNPYITEVTATLTSGSTILIRDNNYIIDNSVVNYFAGKNIIPATGGV